MNRVQIVLLLSGLISPLMLVAAEAKPVETEKKKDAQQVKIDHALYKAASEGRNDEVRDLLENGADVNALISDFTPLMGAAMNGHNETVQLLLERGAKPNLKNFWRRTALMYAAYKGHATIVRLLESRGASVFEQDNRGYFASDLAIQGGHYQLSDYLRTEEDKEQQARGLSL